MTERFVSVCNRLCKRNTGKEDGDRPSYCESWHLLSSMTSGRLFTGFNSQIITCSCLEAL
jgi:hypothetical protein